MRFRWIMTFSVVLSGFLWANARSEEAGARLVVQVSNGTKNGTPVVGDTVTLNVFHQQEPAHSAEAMVDENGQAVFENLPSGGRTSAVARVSHQNMAFQSRPVLLTSTDPNATARVEVYDVSSDLSELSVGTHQITIGPDSGSLQFKEYMQLRNSSDKVIRSDARDAAGKPIVVEVKLPDGFEDLTFSSYFERSAMVVTETGFYDTLAVPPGEYEAMFSYRIDVDGGFVEVVKELSLPTSGVEVFWEGGQGRLEGLGPPEAQLTNGQGAPVEYYQPDAKMAGDRISFRVTGFTGPTSDADTWMMLAVVFGAMVVVVAWRLLRKSTSAKAR